MYLAEEITAETHRFDHSRKKPKRAKPTHQQGPLFADMLHETDPVQKERAHHVCGSTTIYNAKGAARLFCGRRDCPVCFGRRYRRVAARIRIYVKNTGQKLYWKKIHGWEHDKVVRSIKHKPKGEYVCLPVMAENGERKEYIISNVIKGSPVHTDHPRLESSLAIWTKTPNGCKISFSSGFRIKKQGGEKLPQFFGRITLSKILPHAQAVGGTIRKVNKSYVRWKVDTKKLTTRLVEKDIVAYQISMLPTINEKARNAEDALANSISTEQEYEAIPLDKRGNAIAPPVKLRQLLIDSNGTVLHKKPLVNLQLDKTLFQTTSPPPS